MDWTNWLHGRNPFGSIGFDVGNTIAGNAGLDPNDPRLLSLGWWNSQANGSEGGEGTRDFVFDDPNFGSQGIIHNGKPGYVAVGWLLTGGSGPGGSGLDSRIIDTSQVVYDPKWGAITPRSNIRDQTDTVERWMPAVVGAAFGGAVALNAASAGTAASSSTGAFDMGGSAGVFDSAGNPLYTSPAITSGGESFGVFAPGMEQQGALESQLLNSGVTPGSPEWNSALTQAGFDPTLPSTPPGGSPGGNSGTTPGTNTGNTLPNDGSSVSSQLQNANRFRTVFNGARSILNLLGGGHKGNGRRGMDIGSVLGSLPQLLGLLGLGHQAFGNGIGTASGAIQNANNAANRADPWGASGARQHFIDMLTPEAVRSMLNPDPNEIAKDPAYEFQLQQGIHGINLGDAAQGTLRSGNRGTELAKYSQGLASQFEQQQFNNNMARLGLLGRFAGVDSSSPTAAGQMLMGGFNTATDLRNGAQNGLFGGGSKNPLGALGSLFGSGLSGILNLFSEGGLTDEEITNLIGNVGGGDVSDNLFPGFIDDGGGENIFDAIAGP